IAHCGGRYRPRGRSRRSSPRRPPCRRRWRAPDRRSHHADRARCASPASPGTDRCEARLQIELAVDRLAHRKARGRAGESINLRACALDALHLSLEAHRILADIDRHEWTADRALTGRFAAIKPELDQYAAHAARLRVVILSERADHRGLALLEAIERSL